MQNITPRASPRLVYDDDDVEKMEKMTHMTQYVQQSVQRLEDIYNDDHEAMDNLRTEIMKLTFTSQHAHELIHHDIEQFRDSIQHQFDYLKKDQTQEIEKIKADLLCSKEREKAMQEQIIQLREFRSTIKGVILVANIAIAGGFVLLGALLK